MSSLLTDSCKVALWFHELINSSKDEKLLAGRLLALYSDPTIGQFNRWVVQWLKCGLPCFRPTDSLATCLNLTSCDNVNVADIRLPFDAGMIELPERMWKLQKQRYALAVRWGYGIDRETGERLLWITVLPDERNKLHSVLNIIFNPEDTRTVAETIASLRAGEQLCIADGLDRPSLDLVLSDSASSSDYLESQFDIMRFVFNLWIYISETGNGKRHHNIKKPQVRSRKADAGIPEPQIWIIGQEVRVDVPNMDDIRGDGEATALVR